MRAPCDYVLELTFSAPLLSQAPGVLALGVDVAMQRYRGQPVLNGSLIRGNIRHALEEFAELMPDSGLADHPGHEDQKRHTGYISRWFGMQTRDKNYNPNRSGIDFDFFWTLKQPLDDNVAPARRTRIKLEEESGKVEKGALQIIEDCFPSGGGDIVFAGKLHARFATRDEEMDFIHWLGKALDYIPAIGSFKGTGFGRLKSWRCTDISTKARHVREKKFADGNTRIGITLHLDRPFCLGRPRTPDSNRIVSDEMISGNVIKGVIARQYPDGKLPKDLCFEQLIITHAVPMSIPSARPEPWPLSLAVHNEKLADMSSASVAAAWDNAPKFQPDWKAEDYQQAENAWATQKPHRYLSIRSEIDRKEGISKESRLFSLECIDPQGFVWCADIELCQIEESKRPAAFARLQTILQQGLSGIGKTKARAEIEIAQSFTPFKRIDKELPHWRDHHYIVTLQTAARLLPPDLRLSGVNSHVALKKIYQQYWSEQHRDITLMNYFAQQQLTSTYYHQRQHNKGHGDYYPEWLTTAGSVFVLQIKTGDALRQLKRWNRRGLPAHPNADGSEADWRTTPYLPEHGYGEIVINDPKQLALLYQPDASGREVAP